MTHLRGRECQTFHKKFSVKDTMKGDGRKFSIVKEAMLREFEGHEKTDQLVE